MTPEDIARRYDQRSGYELIDYVPVALPLYRLTVDAVTMVHRDLAPIKEFVMRTVSHGLNNMNDVVGFLGIDANTVAATFNELREDHYIGLSNEDRIATILPKGRLILEEAKESRPQDEMLVFTYDRLLRKPVRLPAEELLSPSEVDPQRMIEIRPYPADGPEVDELSLPEVTRILTSQMGNRSIGRDILRLRRIVRRARVFRPGVGLLYKRVRGTEIQVAFIVDDSSDQDLEHAFSASGGPQKMGFVKLIDESTTAAQLRRHLGTDVTRLLPDSNALEDETRKVSLAKFKLQTLTARAERRGDDINSPANASPELLAAKEVLDIAEAHLQSFPARPVRPFEAHGLLMQALSTCATYLAISSREASSHIVDKFFFGKLTDALKRGVEIKINLSRPGTRPTDPAVELEKLRQKFKNLQLESGRETNFYHLVCDDRFAVVCNSPFLSNFSRNRQFFHFAGYILQSSQLVSAYTRRVVAGGTRGKSEE